GFTHAADPSGLVSLLVWMVRKQMWFILLAALAIVAAITGLLPQFMPALAFAPFVLLIAQEVVTYAFNDLIEYGSADDAPKAIRLLGRNVLVSLLTAFFASSLGLALFLAMGSDVSGIDSPNTSSFTPYPLQILLIEGFLPAVLSAALVIIGGVAVTILARRRLEKDKKLSVLGATLVSMVCGLALLVAFQLLMANATSFGTF
ncbi:MAG: hypothetical protein LBG68_00450, partial [Coriobacteriales bacterium]|nr:hypothetical protein [Coriobacteriales bacterium]